MSDRSDLVSTISAEMHLEPEVVTKMISYGTEAALDQLTSIIDTEGDVDLPDEILHAVGGSWITGDGPTIIGWAAPLAGNLPAPDPALGSAVNEEAAVIRQSIDDALANGSANLPSVWSMVDSEDGDHRPVGHMHLRRVLLDLPAIGEVHANAILADLGLEADRHLASLGVGQREAIELAVAEFSD